MGGPTVARIVLHFFSSWWRKSLVLRSPDHIPAAQWPSAGVLEKDDVGVLVSPGFRPVLKGSDSTGFAQGPTLTKGLSALWIHGIYCKCKFHGLISLG